MADAIVRSQDLSNVIRQLSTLQSNQLALDSKMGDLSAGQDLTRSELSSLRQIVEDFIRRDLLAKELQLAQTKLIDVRAQLQNEFGHYKEVRRLAVGLLQATDAGIVATSTMRSLSEELMLLAPRYWLAPAVVALAAWIRDDRDLANRALAEALRRDNDKTALFFALILRRHRRNAATARWLHQYVSRQDPSGLAREFVVVLDAVATGALGQEARPLVLGQVEEWFEQINEREEVREAQIRRWMDLLNGMRGQVSGRYKVLPDVSPTWPTLKALYEGATVHGHALKHLNDLFEGEVVLSHDQRERVDKILDSLVTNYDVEELPARREESRLEQIIEHGGDRAAADRATENEAQAQDERVDILTLLTNAAFFPDKSGASKGTQRLATAMAKGWIDEADARLAKQNRDMLPAAVELKIETWRAKIDDKSTEPDLRSSLASHVDRETNEQIAKVRFTGKPVAAAIIGGVLALLGIIIAASGGVGGGVFWLLVGAALGGWAYNQYVQIPKRREALRQAGEQRKANGLNKLGGAVAESLDIRGEWITQAAMAKTLHEYVAAMAVTAHTNRASDEQRMVN